MMYFGLVLLAELWCKSFTPGMRRPCVGALMPSPRQTRREFTSKGLTSVPTLAWLKVQRLARQFEAGPIWRRCLRGHAAGEAMRPGFLDRLPIERTLFFRFSQAMQFADRFPSLGAQGYPKKGGRTWCSTCKRVASRCRSRRRRKTMAASPVCASRRRSTAIWHQWRPSKALA